ncbi:MAG: acetyl-CoA decarbonylase/synthase complex subunit delta [Eubacteriaceae bacterium]|jgi:acetyl-CoA decarbonylase/synthase complex subunit delta
MPFKKTAQKYPGSIEEITIGTGEKAIKLGGEKDLLFLTDTGNKPAVGIEITDTRPEDWGEVFDKVYGEVMDDPALWAKFVQDNTAADFILLSLSSADPNGADRSVEDCVQTAVNVEAAVDIPLMIGGCKNAEKDAQLFQAVSNALMDKNVVLFSAVEDNYKTVGIAGNSAGHKISGESAVDINLAKQLNILLSQQGIKPEAIVMDIGSAAVGYGFEYVASTMDRIRLAALGQNDTDLQMPIITNIANDAWTVKEAVFPEAEMPEWGDLETRGIDMEVATAAACLTGGSNAIIVRHPKSAETASELISALTQEA